MVKEMRRQWVFENRQTQVNIDNIFASYRQALRSANPSRLDYFLDRENGRELGKLFFKFLVIVPDGGGGLTNDHPLAVEDLAFKVGRVVQVSSSENSPDSTHKLRGGGHHDDDNGGNAPPVVPPVH